MSHPTMAEQEPSVSSTATGDDSGPVPRASLSALSLSAFRRDSKRRSAGSTGFMLNAAQAAFFTGSRVVTKGTQASVRRTTESVTLTKNMLSTKKCNKCGRHFGAEVGKRRHCRRCGEIFCYECCSDKVHLTMYHSRWGVLKNRTSKTQYVCKDCATAVRAIHPEAAKAPRQRILTEEEVRHLASSNNVGNNNEEGAEDHSHGRSRAGSIITLVRKTRARTLDKYMEAIKVSTKHEYDAPESVSSPIPQEPPPSPTVARHESKHRRHNTLDDGFKYRLLQKQQQPIQISLHRAKELRDQFFDGISKSERQEQVPRSPPRTPSADLGPRRQSILGASSNEDSLTMKPIGNTEASSITVQSLGGGGNTWGSFFSNLWGRATSPHPQPPPTSPASFGQEVEFDRAFEREEKALEEALEQSQAQLRANEKHLKESEKLLEKNRADQVKRMTQKLLELQENKIKDAVQMGAAIEKQMLAHAKHLEAHIQAGRFFDETDDEVVDLRDELRSVYLHLDELKVETVFPQCMRWKFRSKVEEALFVGVRDLDIDRMDCNFSIKSSGTDKRVILHMYEIQMSVALYEFVIRGNSARAKLLSKALAPTLNRVELHMTGEWQLPLMFQEGGTPENPASRWVADGKKSFQFHIAKTVENSSIMQLPDSFLQWLVNSLIPSVIESAVISALPTRDLGWFLCESRNEALIRGKLQIHGDTSPRVWKAPLVGPTHASIAARRALGINEEEAAVLDFLLRSHLATLSGFPSNKAATLVMIHSWRLQYAAHSLVALAPMLAVIESGSRMKIPANWTLQLLRRIDELAAKPVTIQIQLLDVELDLDVKEMLTTITALYLKGVEDTVAKEQELEAARRAAKKKIRRGSEVIYSPAAVSSSDDSRNPEEALRMARKAVARIHRNFDRTLIPLLRDQARTQFNAMLAGGSGGILAFSFTNFLADVCLPKKFEFSTILWQSPEVYEGFVLKVNGKDGPAEGEYTMRFNVLPVGEETPEEEEEPEGDESSDSDDEDEEDDAQTTLKNVKIELFPIGRPSGAVHLAIDAWRSSLLLSSLMKAVIATASIPSEAPLLEPDLRHDALKEERRVRRASHAQTELTRDLLIQSRKVVENLWGSFRTMPTMSEGDQASRDVIELAGGIDPLGIQFHQQLGSNSGSTDDEQYTQKILMPYLTSDAFALHVDVRGMELILKKVKSSDGNGESMRLALVKSMRHERDSQCVSFSMRRNLQDVFQADLLPI